MLFVEGYTDVISMHQSGIENVVASSGTALTHGQIRLIHRFTSNITVLYDGDAAGIKAALRGIDLLLEDGMFVKVVLLPEGEDPDSFAQSRNAESFLKYMAENETDFIRFKTRLLLDEAGNDPIKRAELVSSIVSSIAVIPDRIVRTVYVKDCGSLLGIDERVLVDEVNKKVAQKKVEPGSFVGALVKDSERAASVDNLQQPNATGVPDVSTIVAPLRISKDEQQIYKLEYAILYYIVRYGMSELFKDEVEQEDLSLKTVIDFVQFDLERDGFSFSNTLYAAILDEAILKSKDADFNPSRYFLSHPQQQVSKIAADLMTDKYILSNIHIKQYGNNLTQEDTPLSEEKSLYKMVPRALTELKNAHIINHIKSVRKQIAIKQKDSDFESVGKLMQELKDLQESKKLLAKELGERIILGF